MPIVRLDLRKLHARLGMSSEGIPVKFVAMVLALCVSSSAVADPVEIDLSAEKREYESKAHPRVAGLVLLGGTVVLGVVSALQYSFVGAAREQLLAQRAPVDLARRQVLVKYGEQTNALAVGAGLLGIGTAIGSAYLLHLSF